MTSEEIMEHQRREREFRATPIGALFSAWDRAHAAAWQAGYQDNVSDRKLREVWEAEGTARKAFRDALDVLMATPAEPVAGLPEGWVAVPRDLPRAMLTAFAVGFSEPARSTAPVGPGERSINTLDHMDGIAQRIWARVLSAAPPLPATPSREQAGGVSERGGAGDDEQAERGLLRLLAASQGGLK